MRRASLCNVSECERLGIGGAGTAISVIKANKIIPKVIRVEQTVGSLDIPEKCPVCGEQTEVRVGAQSGVKTLHCTNPACAAKQRKKFERFVSKEAVDIDGMSGQTIARFIAEGWIRDYADLFHLVDEHRGDILQMEGFGEKSVANLEAAVEKARGTTARRFLYGLSIPLVGQEVAKLFLSAYPLRELIETARGTEDPEIFTGIPGIGPEISASFVRWMQEPENRHVLDRLLAEIRPEEESKGAGDARCDGLVFVVTGDVHIYKNRKELKAYIEAQGGKVTGSGSGATSFLINNDAGSASSKNRKAKELGIPVLTEEEFVARFG